MTQTSFSALTARQRRFFQTGVTLDIRYRTAALKRLQKAVQIHQSELTAALRHDLGKSDTESYLSELGPVLSRLRWLLKHLPRLTRDRRVNSSTRRRPTPYGVTLILSPWNYPLLLTLCPLADALAAGNTAIVRPSPQAPETSRLLARLLGSIFPAAYVEVADGNPEDNTQLLQEQYDYIFSGWSEAQTGLILEQAAKHRTPVTGIPDGRSVCIVHRSADLSAAARRVVFGKFLNCGQSAAAPNHVLCDEAVMEEFLHHLRLQVQRQYGKDYKYNLSYGRILSKKHFDRLSALLDPERVFLGGSGDQATLRIEPTVLTGVDWSDPVMEQPIFGPILPVLPFRDADQLLDTLRSREKPPFLYLFARDRRFTDTVTARWSFGSCTINDAVPPPVPGQQGFDTFTRYLPIAGPKCAFLPLRCQPYTPLADRLIRLLLR